MNFSLFSMGTATALAWIAMLATPMAAAGAASEGAGKMALIPWPQSIQVRDGAMELKAGLRVVASDPTLKPLAEILAGEVKAVSGQAATVADGPARDGDVILELSPSLKGERYELTVADRAIVKAGNYQAVALGTVTLLQAIEKSGDSGAQLPHLKITDEPAVACRGLMIDLARNGHSIDTLEQIVRMCRFYKVRYLQLHLTDDQSFTFPSTAYPKLATPRRSYTLEQMKALVAYADARGVTIVPELDIPAHASAMVKAMPELFRSPAGGIIDFKKPEVVAAVKTLIDELAEVFASSPYIHLGADEANLGPLARNAEYQAVIEKLGVKDIHGLFNYFLNQIDAQVKSHGKRAIAWEGFEIFPPGPAQLDTSVIVMPFDNYRSVQTTYIDHGHEVINSSWYPMYLIPGILTTTRNIFDWDLYTFGNYKSYSPRDPKSVKQYRVTRKDKVLGAQMCAWEQPQHMEIPSLRRRMATMIQRVWNPSVNETYDAYIAKLDQTDARLDALLATTTPGVVNVSASDSVYPDHIEVMWRAPGGYPGGYTLLRGVTDNPSEAKVIATNLKETHWTDKTAGKGQTYHYWAKATNPFGESELGAPGTGSLGTQTVLALAYDGFVPPADGKIEGENGGEGWAGPWRISREGGKATFKAQGLTYPQLQTSGGCLNIDFAGSDKQLDLKRDTTGLQGVEGTELWFSYLLRVDRLKDGHVLLMPNNSGAMPTGKPWGAGLGVLNRTVVAAEPGKTYFIVAHYTSMKGNDIVRAWVNPSLDSEPSADAPDVSYRDDGDMGKPGHTIRVSLQPHGRGSYDLDELRIGSTWAEVAPKIGQPAARRVTTPAQPAPISAAPAPKAPEKVVTLKGRYVTVEIRQSDIGLLKNRQAFSRFLDDVYAQMRELTTAQPTVIIRSGKVPQGVWGYAGGTGVMIDEGAFRDVLKDFNDNKIAFGLVHEMGHCFDGRDKPRWYISPHSGGEEMANLKLSFAFDRLLRADNAYRIDFGKEGRQTGWDYNNRYFVPAGDKYLADSSREWTSMSSDELHAFHLGLARVYGWDVLKKWFRAYPVIESFGFWAPDSTDDPQRMILEGAIFEHYAKTDLMPLFEKWRLPITRADLDAAVEHYRLKEVFARVDAQYAAEVRSGAIKVDHLPKR